MPTPYQSAGSVTNPQAQGGVTAPVSYTPTPPTISTINSGNTQPQSLINVNPNTAGSVGQTDIAGTVNGGNALIAANNSSVNPPTTASTDPNSILASLKSAFPAPPVEGAPPVADPTASNAAQQALLDAQGNLTGVNNQLAALNAQAKGADIQIGNNPQNPSFIVSGQQAQSDRNYAIKSIPLQAQALSAQAAVASAQGNATLANQMLNQAQTHLDALYKIQNDNATTQYNYQTNLVDKAITMADANQKAALADVKSALATNQTDFTNAINNAQSVSKTAVTNGNGAIAAAIAQIPVPSINSPTFASDLKTYNTAVANLQATIPLKPTAAQQNSGNIPKTATQVQNAAVGTALSDAKSAIAQGADPNAVKQAFLAKYPADNAKWSSYFSDATKGTSSTNAPVYPTPASPATKSFNLFDPSTW